MGKCSGRVKKFDRRSHGIFRPCALLCRWRPMWRVSSCPEHSRAPTFLSYSFRIPMRNQAVCLVGRGGNVWACKKKSKQPTLADARCLILQHQPPAPFQLLFSRRLFIHAHALLSVSRFLFLCREKKDRISRSSPLAHLISYE